MPGDANGGPATREACAELLLALDLDDAPDAGPTEPAEAGPEASGHQVGPERAPDQLFLIQAQAELAGKGRVEDPDRGEAIRGAAESSPPRPEGKPRFRGNDVQ